jgi:hypothetical protein
MTFDAISSEQAQQFVQKHIGGQPVPVGLIWYAVQGIQHYPVNRRHLYLVAGEQGLEGVYGIEPKPAPIPVDVLVLEAV